MAVINISGVTEDQTIVTKIPSATDILSGDAAVDGNDTTGGTKRFDDQKPEDKIDIPTEKIVASLEKNIGYIVIGVVAIIAALFIFRSK